MAKVNVEFNYGVAGKVFNVEPKVGRKNVIIQTDQFYIESEIIDKVTMEARAKWITVYRESQNYKKFQEVVELLQNLSKKEEIKQEQIEIPLIVEEQVIQKTLLTKFQVFQQLVAQGNVKLDNLNDQEIQIIQLTKEGKSINEISQAVGLAESTIKDKINGRKGRPGILDKISA